MKNFSVILLLSVLFSQELEVDGALKVTGEIDATGNVLTNVGDPVSETDAVNMRTLNTNSSLRPNRIYRLQVTDETVYTTPIDKYWRLLINYNGNAYSNELFAKIIINNIEYELLYSRNNGGQGIDTKEYWMLPGDTFWCHRENGEQEYHIVIFEYSFSNSGIEQGMDYIEP